MKMLNVHVYQDEKDKSIKIRFDVLVDADAVEPKSEFSIEQWEGEGGDTFFADLIRTMFNFGALGLSKEEESFILNTPEENYLYPDKLKLMMLLFCTASRAKSSIETIKTCFIGSDRRLEKEAFTPQILSTLYYKMEEECYLQCDQDKANFKQHSLVYNLSTCPHIALNFLLSCVNVIPMVFNYEAIYFCSQYTAEGLPESFTQSETDSYRRRPQVVTGLFYEITSELESLPERDFQDFCKMQSKQLKDGLFKNLVGLPNPSPQYEYSLEAIQKIGKEYIENHENPTLFTDLMQVDSRCQLFWKPVVDLLFDVTKPNDLKLNLLLTLAKESIATSQHAEFDYMMHSIHLLAKKKLYASCLGIKSNEEREYDWERMEWDFIRDAEFKLREDGRLAIVNLKNNASYLLSYAPTKGDHGVFEEGMRDLGKVLGLEFADCDFHQEIIFTPECTKRLFEQGLQWTLAYVKSALHLNNRASFFARYSVEKQTSPFAQLPWELTSAALKLERADSGLFSSLSVEDEAMILADSSPFCCR